MPLRPLPRMCAAVVVAVATTLSSCAAATAAAASPYEVEHRARTGERLRHLSNSADALTLVVHLTIDRMPKLQRWCDGWQGPISAAVYVRPQDAEDAVLAEVTASPCVRDWADLHVVRPADARLRRATDMFSNYPFNVVRNAALDGATRTTHVLLMDVDFAMPGATMAALWAKTSALALRQGAADAEAGEVGGAVYVVPAFETVTKATPAPQTVDEVVAAYKMQRVTLFYGHYCVPCHHPTDARRWVLSKDPDAMYEVEYVEAFEPYVVAPRYGLPRYDERFIGRGWDKMSFFYELDHLGYRYFVLPKPFFLVHAGRGDLPGSGQYTDEYMKRQEVNKKLWRRFKADLRGEPVSESDGDSDGGDAGGADGVSGDADAGLATLGGEDFPLTTAKGGDAAGGAPAPNAPSSTDVQDYISFPLQAETVCAAKRDVEVTSDRLRAALGWVCGQDGAPCAGIREHPDGVLARADWAFDRWFRMHKGAEGEEVACDFAGAAELRSCGVEPARCVPKADVEEDEVGVALEWVCQRLGRCGWGEQSVRREAQLAFTAYFLAFRCTQPAWELCSFGGVAELELLDTWEEAMVLPAAEADEGEL